MRSRDSNCSEVRSELSGYVDRTLGPARTAWVEQHVAACSDCEMHAEQLGALRGLLREHARVAPPADLALRIRLRISHHSAPAMSAWSRLFVHLNNFLRPVAIPAVSGLLTTILIFGGFIYQFALPLDIPNDVPLALQTPPRLKLVPQITFTTGPDGVLVQAEVDYQGRVTNFQVLDGAGDDQQMRDLRHVLLFTQFDPATRFGVPTAGRLIFNLRQISVKG